MRSIVILFLLCCHASTTFAQEQPIVMATDLTTSGKIYVVVVCLVVIFVGLVAYLVVLDKKIKKLETREGAV